TFSYINTDTKGRQLVSNYIKDVLVDSKGNVWVGTVSGINLLKKGANKAITFTTEQSGLTSNYINCIEEDLQGNIWVGTHKGGLNLYLPKENKFKNYNVSSGLVNEN